MILYNIEQQSEAWHDARIGRITGTRFKALMAKESTATYQDLITNIACEIITGRAEETYTNAIMEHGIETEPEARKEYENIFGIEVKQVGFIIPDEINKYHEWIGISPDGLIEDGLIEIKCPLMKTHLEYINLSILPSEYKYQVQGQLFVTGLKFCDFMSYVEGMKSFIIRVYPDFELFKEFEPRLDIAIAAIKNKIVMHNNYDINLL
jgi:putative phage-type endonuclease